jgi:hypothetical protein
MLTFELAGMPMASAVKPFSWVDASDSPSPFVNGLVEGSMDIPLASKARR